MCKTVILKPIFIVGLISSMTLTGIALYFPNWQAYENENGEVETRGLLKNCIQTSLNNSQDQAQLAGADNLLLQRSARDQVLLAAKEPCISVWEEAEAYVKICISLIGVSLALCTIALLWSIMSFCVCCCPNLFGPIGILTLLGGFANLGAVAVFLYNTIKDWEAMYQKALNDTNIKEDADFFTLDCFCTYLMIISGIVLIAVSILAAVIQCVLKKTPVP